MKKLAALILVALMILCACQQEEPVDYTDAVVGVWYAVEYENEVVEFRSDGTVADTYCSKTTYGDWIIDNENALIWCNFGDDVFNIRISCEDGNYILLDNNGTLVRETELEQYRTEK